MTVHIYLDLSTSHLTRDTAGRLDSILPENRAAKLREWGWPAMTIAPYDHGYFVTVPGRVESVHRALPKDLRDALLHARRTGVNLLRFDSDGDIADGLPTYTW